MLFGTELSKDLDIVLESSGNKVEFFLGNISGTPQNKTYKERSADQEIVFFYLNVSSPTQEPYLARIEIPMWVAQDKALVNAVHALIYSQCQITDRYPYALTRADEVAVVPTFEKRALDGEDAGAVVAGADRAVDGGKAGCAAAA